MGTKLMRRLNKSKGFTLIELIVVISIIAVIASIAISSALHARVRGNESSAMGSLKALQSSATSYRGANGAYPVDLTQLGAAYVGGGLETGSKSGYNFVLANGNNGETFTATAIPKTAVFSGGNSFCTDTLNVIYVYTNAAQIASDGNACPAGGTALQT